MPILPKPIFRFNEIFMKTQSVFCKYKHLISKMYLETGVYYIAKTILRSNNKKKPFPFLRVRKNRYGGSIFEKVANAIQ